MSDPRSYLIRLPLVRMIMAWLLRGLLAGVRLPVSRAFITWLGAGVVNLTCLHQPQPDFLGESAIATGAVALHLLVAPCLHPRSAAHSRCIRIRLRMMAGVLAMGVALAINSLVLHRELEHCLASSSIALAAVVLHLTLGHLRGQRPANRANRLKAAIAAAIRRISRR